MPRHGALAKLDRWDVLMRHPAVGFVQAYVSVSRLGVYEQCPRKFFFEYVEKSDPISETDSSGADLGKVVHSGCERLYRWVVRDEFSGIIPEQQIARAYREAFSDRDTTAIGVEMFDEGLQLMRAYFDRRPTVDHWSILAVEQEFNVEIAPFIFVKGFMDLVEVEDQIVTVRDYKSGANLFTQDDLDSSLQAGLYLLVARKLWPWAKGYRFVFDMLRHDREQWVDRGVADLRIVREYVISVTSQIEQPFHPWPAKLSTLCGWCRHRERCDVFKKAADMGAEIVKANDDNAIEAVAVERLKIDAVLKALDQRKKAIDKILKARIEEEEKRRPGERIELVFPQVVYRTIPINRTSYPVDGVVEIVSSSTGLSPDDVRKELVDPMVSKSRVDTMLKKIRDDTERRSMAMISMQLAEISEQVFAFAKIDAKTDKGPKLPRASKPKALPSPDLKCGFCGASPAKRVDRSGAVFNVCEEHAKKRKPPTG